MVKLEKNSTRKPAVKKDASPAKRKKTGKEEIKEIQAELEEKEKTMEEYFSKLQYLQAEFENYKRIESKEKEKLFRYANESLIIKLLDVYENLERAIESGKTTKEKDVLIEGIEMTYNQLKDILEKEGLSPIKAEGEKFDPFKHEALLKENKEDCEEEIILEELLRGYSLKDKVIRYSKVKICKR